MRPLRQTDAERVIAIATGSGLFPSEAASFLAEQMAGWFASGCEPGRWIVDEAGDRVVGVAFYEPRPATDRVWALTMIAVDPRAQGTGRGEALLRFVEDDLRRKDQRLLVIETSSTAAFDSTRRFYARRGYDAVATVPSYFEDGDDMVLFYKDLRKPSGGGPVG